MIKNVNLKMFSLLDRWLWRELLFAWICTWKGRYCFDEVIWSIFMEVLYCTVLTWQLRVTLDSIHNWPKTYDLHYILQSIYPWTLNLQELPTGYYWHSANDIISEGEHKHTKSIIFGKVFGGSMMSRWFCGLLFGGPEMKSEVETVG